MILYMAKIGSEKGGRPSERSTKETGSEEGRRPSERSTKETSSEEGRRPSERSYLKIHMFSTAFLFLRQFRNPWGYVWVPKEWILE